VRGPACVPKSRDISIPLTLGEFDIHVVTSIDMSDEPFGEPSRRPPYQRVASRHHG
jgi:hypothetical protein